MCACVLSAATVILYFPAHTRASVAEALQCISLFGRKENKNPNFIFFEPQSNKNEFALEALDWMGIIYGGTFSTLGEVFVAEVGTTSNKDTGTYAN